MGRNMKSKLNKIQRLEYLRVRAQKMRENKKKSVSIADNNKESNSPTSFINLDNQLQPIVASQSNNGLEICQQYINTSSTIITACDRLKTQKGMESHLNCEKRNKRKQQHDVDNEDKEEQPLPYEIELEENALKETVGLPGMNVYIKKIKEKLATGYFHDDNQVQIIFSNLDLDYIPRCWLPEVQLSLASNVLKIQTPLSRIIIHADYTLVRNKSDIIYDPKEQDPFKSSPFLFEQVQDVGRVAISMDGCTLSGFIITILNGESVDLGYDHFKFVNCQYNIEIYRPGEDSPPVIAKYNLYRGDDYGLNLTHLLMKPILTEELVPKLQAAMFSFVNTSAIFGNALREYRENHEIVFQASVKYFTEFVRKLNRITVEKNHGAMEMEDYVMHWDDGRIKPSEHHSAGKTITLKDMVLTGLDTMYTAHLGGPFKIDTIMIADEIRFSSLQVRGKLEINSTWLDTISFTAEISDMAVELHMGELPGDQGNSKESKRKHGIKKFEVTEFRRITFTIPIKIFGGAESLVGGYLIKEVPKLLRSHLSAIFSEALQKESKLKAPSVTIVSDDNDDDNGLVNMVGLSSDSKPLTDSEDQDYSEMFISRERDTFKNTKTRFRNANRPRRLRRYRSRKRVADNQIRKK